MMLLQAVSSHGTSGVLLATLGTQHPPPSEGQDACGIIAEDPDPGQCLAMVQTAWLHACALERLAGRIAWDASMLSRCIANVEGH
jgi:hypothetical protein